MTRKKYNSCGIYEPFFKKNKKRLLLPSGNLNFIFRKAQVFEFFRVILANDEIMECRNLENKLLFYIEGALSESEEELVKNHLATCKACENKYAFIKSTFQQIEKEKQIAVNPFLYTRLQGKFEKATIAKRKWVMAPIMISTVLVLGLFVGTLIGQLTTSPKITDESNYEVAYLFNDTQLEGLEFALLNEYE